MNLLKQLVSCNINQPTAIFQLKNGDFIVSSFIEDEEELKTLLINPMMIITSESDTGQAGLSLEPYMNAKIIKQPNFFIDTADIFSVHEPTEKMFAFYIANVIKMNNNIVTIA